jgi:hypothetical protein
LTEIPKQVIYQRQLRGSSGDEIVSMGYRGLLGGDESEITNILRKHERMQKMDESEIADNLHDEN